MKHTKLTIKPVDLSKLKTYSIRKRKNLVNLKQFARLNNPPAGLAKFIEGLPDILAGRDFKELIQAIVRAYKGNHIVGAAIGAHVIKCGLSPIIIDLMKRGIIKAIALNGAGAIHDYEISLIGATSEDVSESLKHGEFGMAKETADFFTRATKNAVDNCTGLGDACGELILKDKNPYSDYSILAQAAKLKIPITVHVAIGTDTIHMHPNISGKELGEATLTDFRILTSVVCGLNKGVWLNIGSAVILPEVFLKAVSISRNLCYPLNDLITANLDMIQHYRGRMNVTGRPISRGINLIGHHEVMLPLLRWGILSAIK
jgi:hypothetical protein